MGRDEEKNHISRRCSPPSSLTATACVFDLIETTTPALVVKSRPFVDGSVVRYREALRSEGVVVTSPGTHVRGGFAAPFDLVRARKWAAKTSRAAASLLFSS